VINFSIGPETEIYYRDVRRDLLTATNNPAADPIAISAPPTSSPTTKVFVPYSAASPKLAAKSHLIRIFKPTLASRFPASAAKTSVIAITLKEAILGCRFSECTMIFSESMKKRFVDIKG
jgi:hypothetical protein